MAGKRESSRARAQILTFRVTPDEAREFRLVAKAEGVSTSAAIRRAMRDRADRLIAEPGPLP